MCVLTMYPLCSYIDYVNSQKDDSNNKGALMTLKADLMIPIMTAKKRMTATTKEILREIL